MQQELYNLAFNPRSRVGNDKAKAGLRGARFAFNPRSRVGNDSLYLRWRNDYKLSIHVPAWGTTVIENILHRKSYTFNPRSRVGNDDRLLPETNDSGTFNPRSRVGNDVVIVVVDIARRAFNPRSRVGNDRSCSEPMMLCCNFQSTFPRGERRFFSIHLLILSSLSIHVPAWGTTYRTASTHGITVFQSTFPRGERRVKVRAAGIHGTFNPRSRVGNDICHATYKPCLSTFNPRSRVGNDVASLRIFSFLILLSIHVPAWGTTRLHLLTFLFPCFQSTFPRGERHI